MFKSSKVSEPDFTDYREDVLKNWKWTWDWKWDTYKRLWSINNLVAHCPRCNTTMIEHHNVIHGSIFDCPRCDFYAKDSRAEDPQKIESLIIDNIKRKNRDIK